MGLTSEQAHWIVGGELSALALVSMLYETRMWRSGALRLAPAATLLLFAAQGALIPVLHGDVGHESMDAATGQHFALAGLCLVVGLAELLRAEARLRRWIWRVPLPIGMLAAGAIFGTWAFPAGWSRVVLLRRDAAGLVVVADAVRVRQQ